MKIAIIGVGWVGYNTLFTLHKNNQNNKYTIYDNDLNKINEYSKGFVKTNDSVSDAYAKEIKINEIVNLKHPSEYKEDYYDYTIITLPTYINGNNDINTSLFDKVMKEYSHLGSKLIIRSTLPINYKDVLSKWGVNYWPEFGSMGDQMKKNILPERQIFFEAEKGLASKLFVNQKYSIMGLPEAIYIKNTHNAWDAMTVLITQIFKQQADENEINFELIKDNINPLLSSTRDRFRAWDSYIDGFYLGDMKNTKETINNKNAKELIESILKFNITLK